MSEQAGDALADSDDRLRAAGWHIETTRTADGWLTSQWVGPDGRADSAEFVRLVHGEDAAQLYREMQRRREERLRHDHPEPVAAPSRRASKHLVTALLMVCVSLLLFAQLVRIAVLIFG